MSRFEEGRQGTRPSPGAIPSRRRFLGGLAALAGAPVLAAGCEGDEVPASPSSTTTTTAVEAAAALLAVPGSPGLVDETGWNARVSDYLALATRTLDPGDPTSVAAHLIRGRRDPGFTWDADQVSVDGFAPVWDQLDGWKDTGDFRILYLHWLVALGPGVIHPDVEDAIRARMTGFRYWYTDPLPPGRLDHKWFWSENHRIIFAVDEYLAGLAFPDDVFAVAGITGAEHMARAGDRIREWIDERARFGFFEWHSHVYMLKNITPLLTLVELADDRELVEGAAMALDLCLFDLAAHLQRGSYGVTAGRTYRKDKMRATDQDTFGTAKLIFDDTDRPYPSASDTGATYFCAAVRYRPPEAIRAIAVDDGTGEVRERHGVRLDPHAAVVDRPEVVAGYDYDDPADLAFWWSQGALTAWQVIDQTIETADRWRLWETDLFSGFASLRAAASGSRRETQELARSLAPMIAFGLLGEAHTLTWRSPEAMLSTVVDHRVGDHMNQVHAWQATLDADAQVFTTHPMRAAADAARDPADDGEGYWTGTASMPRSAQVGRTAVHLYRPAFAAPTDPLLGPLFGYQPLTHAFFPTERFDEVIEGDGWTAGRRGDGFVALWSWRPTAWTDPAGPEATVPWLQDRYDLVAAGGPDNVWVVEVGSRDLDGDFAEWVRTLRAAPPEVERAADRLAVHHRSPAAGDLRFGTEGPLVLDGAEVPLGDHPRHDSRWATIRPGARQLEIRTDGHRLELDFDARRRVVT